MTESLIKPAGKIIQKTIKINLSDMLLNNMQDYMEWANFDNLDNFVSECVNYVLDNDKKYQRFLKEKMQEKA